MNAGPGSIDDRSPDVRKADRPAVPQSALIVRVAEAERYVSALRERFDPSSAQGVPAHITLLFPFKPPGALTADDGARLRALASDFPAFAFRLADVDEFPGTIYLAPKPAAPFIALTNALCASFPGLLPYHGAHAAVVPHLTVARVDPLQRDGVVSALCTALPKDGIGARCDEITLIEDTSGRWRLAHVFALAGRAA